MSLVYDCVKLPSVIAVTDSLVLEKAVVTVLEYTMPPTIAVFVVDVLGAGLIFTEGGNVIVAE